MSKSNELAHGAIRLTDRGYFDVQNSTLYYFWQGVLIRSKEAFEELTKISKMPDNWLGSSSTNFAYHISNFTDGFVGNLPNINCLDLDEYFKNVFYHKKTIARNKSFTPKF